MKLLIFSDLHAHTHQAYSRPTSAGGTSRLLDTIRVLSFIREKSAETGIKDVLFGGDLFEAKGRVPVVTLNAVYRELDQWREAGMNMVMIPGNHDLAVRSGDEHALEVLQELGILSIVSSPSWVFWNTECGECIGITAVPFRDDFRKEWFAVMPNSHGVKDESLRICLAHGVVQGSRFNLDNDNALSDYTNDSIIPVSWLEPFDLSVVGHVHLPQKMGDGGRILIPGQPWQQFPHEHKQKRGIWEVEIDKGGISSCVMHEVPGIPRFFLVELSEGGTFVWQDKTVSIEEHIPGNIVLMTPKNAMVPSQIIGGAHDKLLELGAIYVDILPPQVQVDKNAPRVAVDVKDSPYDTLKKTVSSGHVSLRGHSVEAITSLGETILDEVLEEE